MAAAAVQAAAKTVHIAKTDEFARTASALLCTNSAPWRAHQAGVTKLHDVIS